MTAAQAVVAGLLVVTLLAQAAWPAWRLLLVLSGAAACTVAVTALGLADGPQLLSEVPWDVLVLLVALGLVSDLIGASRLFGILAARATQWSGARPGVLLGLLSVGMFLVSGVVNNLTALMLVLPVVLILFQLMGVTQSFTSWTLGTLLVACNLGGAATPIGDFPAVLLLSRGTMGFGTYLREAAPVACAALALMLGAVALVRPWRGVGTHAASGPMAVAVMGALYRRTRVRQRLLVPGAAALGVMLVAWTVLPAGWNVSPGLVAWVGAMAALAASPTDGEHRLRHRVDVEATLFLLSLFLMVGAVRHTGLFTDAARLLLQVPDPTVQRVLLVAAAALLTGVFSAGPSMAALLDVAEQLARQGNPEAVYVGLAFGVCAGSSMFLTAATSGPLAQALTERARLRGGDGTPLVFGFAQHVGPGLAGFAVTLMAGLAYTVWR